MEKIIAELAEMLASAERVKTNAERRYLEADEYQDGNGATYDIERRQWVG